MSKVKHASETSCTEWADRLLSITKDVRRRDLSLQLGEKISWDDVSTDVSRNDVQTVKTLCGTKGISGRIYYQAADHFLRTRLEPFQAMLSTWMNGAKAEVQGKQIPFNDIITWCQDAQDNRSRQVLAQEVRSLCRFLAPFSHVTWKVLLSLLKEELNYPDYITYCGDKKGISLTKARETAKDFLSKSKKNYRQRIEPLLKEITGLDMNKGTRFDAIYILGLRYIDPYFPRDASLEKILNFFEIWGIRIKDHPALNIHILDKPGSQSSCIPIEIPEDVRILVGPLGGWLDLESLFHEMGHALSFIYTDPNFSPQEKDFFHSAALSEAFAFLLQKMCLSRVFLERILELDTDAATTVSSIHSTKWLALARRYAAKFVIEVDNFQHGRLQRGQDLYAKIMEQETGFHYDPETYLFDLMPDFYSLDYFLAYLGAAEMWDYLNVKFGEDWPMKREAGQTLIKWWNDGNRMDLSSFMKKYLGMALNCGSFLRAFEMHNPG